MKTSSPFLKAPHRRCAIYNRKSVMDETEFGSIEQNVNLCHRLVEQMQERTNIRHLVVAELVDEGASGGNVNRPKYQELLAMIRSGQIDAIFANEISRLSRSTKDFCDLMALCKEHGVALHIRGLDVDPNGPMGEFVFRLLANVAELERQITIRRVRDSATSALINNKKLNGGKLPKGLDYGSRPGFPIANEKELAEVSHLMKVFVSTGSMKSTLDEAGKLGISNKAGAPFNFTTLRALLTNKLLIGKKVVRHGPQDELTTEIDLPHGAVVSPDLFQSVQEQLLKNYNNRIRNIRRTYQLSGLVYTVDNIPLRTQSSKTQTANPFYYYYCKERGLRLNAENLEREVFMFFRKVFRNSVEIDVIARELGYARQTEIALLNAKLGEVAKQIKALEAEDGRLLEQFKKLAMQSGTHVDALNWLNSQTSSSNSRLSALRLSLDGLVRNKEQLLAADLERHQVRGALEGLFKHLEQASPQVLRQLWSRVIKRIEVTHHDRARIVWQIPNDTHIGRDGWFITVEGGMLRVK